MIMEVRRGCQKLNVGAENETTTAGNDHAVRTETIIGDDSFCHETRNGINGNESTMTSVAVRKCKTVMAVVGAVNRTETMDDVSDFRLNVSPSETPPREKPTNCTQKYQQLLTE